MITALREFESINVTLGNFQLTICSCLLGLLNETTEIPARKFVIPLSLWVELMIKVNWSKFSIMKGSTWLLPQQNRNNCTAPGSCDATWGSWWKSTYGSFLSCWGQLDFFNKRIETTAPRSSAATEKLCCYLVVMMNLMSSSLFALFFRSLSTKQDKNT